jgi:hypothetical protein
MPVREGFEIKAEWRDGQYLVIKDERQKKQK